MANGKLHCIGLIISTFCVTIHCFIFHFLVTLRKT
jgi:hypothetical protein